MPPYSEGYFSKTGRSKFLKICMYVVFNVNNKKMRSVRWRLFSNVVKHNEIFYKMSYYLPPFSEGYFSKTGRSKFLEICMYVVFNVNNKKMRSVRWWLFSNVVKHKEMFIYNIPLFATVFRGLFLQNWQIKVSKNLYVCCF